jgi:hypothetical protein
VDIRTSTSTLPPHLPEPYPDPEAYDRVYRRGRYADALTSCGSAFESVLKTICTAKKWLYNPDKAMCPALLRTAEGANGPAACSAGRRPSARPRRARAGH